MSALAYVRRMRRMNLTGKAAVASHASAASLVGDGISAAWGLNWADKTFGQGLSSLTKGASPAPDASSALNHDHVRGTDPLQSRLTSTFQYEYRVCCSNYLRNLAMLRITSKA